MESQYHKELRVAKSIALQAWHKIAQFYDGNFEVELKGDNSPVTIADKISNTFIVNSIKEFFPADSIVSEEDATVIGGRRTWHIDPIDGTKGFIKRNAHFVIHIGLCYDGLPVLGVVYWSTVGDMYSGIVGVGAWRENERGAIELKLGKSVNKKFLTASVNGDPPIKGLESVFEELGVKAYSNTGSEGLRMMKLAEGKTDLRISESYQAPGTWDLCAPQAIVEAATGIVKYIDGSQIIYKNNGKLEKRYIAAINKELMDKMVTICAKTTNQKTL